MQNLEQNYTADKFNHFENFISLGYFCEVAKDLERLGLRNQSSPFDWVISYFPSVIDAIDQKFKGFLEFDNLSQNTITRNHYHEDVYNIYFYHDFNKYKSLESQYDSVKEKYDRRINRFLNSIKEPTLFIRYISNEEQDENHKSTELIWIEKNYQYILSTIKRYNTENEILFIGDETVHSDVIKIFNVKKDDGDRVSRQPIYNNTELYPILSSIKFPGKEANQERYRLKERKAVITRIKNKILNLVKGIFCKEYHHSKTHSVADK